MSFDHPDAVVIGSGAGGGVAAKILAEGGLKVVLLEKGQNHFVGLDRPEGILTNHFGNDDIKQVQRDFIDQDPRIEPRTFRNHEGEEAWVGKVNSIPTTVGGGTITYAATSVRTRPKDFRIRSIYGQIEGTSIEDWPISYDDLEPYFDEAEKIVGVQGEAGVNPYEAPRSNPFPMPPGIPKYVDSIWAKVAKDQGYQPFPSPVAINSVAYRGRPACVNCGFCDRMGCAVNAKGSTAVTAVRDALLSGNCELRPDCFVFDFKTNAAGTSVESVEYIDARGDRVTLSAGLFVIAGNAIESARLCLMATSDKHPDGLGNSSGLAGRNLMFHHIYNPVGVFPFRTHQHRGRVGSHAIDEFNRTPDEDPDQPFGGGILEFGTNLHPIDEAKNVMLLGENHKKYMKKSLFRDHLLGSDLIAEDPPVPTNRVDLDPNVKDVYGFPVSRITYQAHATDAIAAAYIQPKVEALLEEAGALFTHWSPTTELTGVPDTKHLMGTLRMGDDPAASVTDKYCKFHDLDNLYCADSSVYVTSTGYNPTLTIQALAAWTARHILEPSRRQP